MELFEDRTLELLRDFDVPVPAFGTAASPAAARDLCAALGGGSWVVKAGLRPGDHVALVPRIDCASPEAVERAAAALLGQTIMSGIAGSGGSGSEGVGGAGGGPEGRLTRVLVEATDGSTAGCYVGMALDRMFDRIVLVGSPLGGTAVGDIASKAPAGIVRETVDPILGLQPFQVRRFLGALAIAPQRIPLAAAVLGRIYQAFIDLEGTALEVSRFVIEEDAVVVRDVTLLFDHSAVHRQHRLRDLVARDEPAREELLAAEWDLECIPMGGTVGLVVSGSALGAATADLLRMGELEPAIIVDLGSGATVEGTAAGVRLALRQPGVEVVLVNLFAGLNKCDVVARGIVQVMERLAPPQPVVVRLSGTNTNEGNRVLGECSRPLRMAASLAEAVALTLELGGGRGEAITR